MLVQDTGAGQTPAARLSDFGLTRRETEVAMLLLDSKSRDEIADLLFISMGTVNTHCTNIYKKVGCGSAKELAALVMPNRFEANGKETPDG